MDITSELVGKKFVITGAANGIGKVLCTKLHQLGAEILAIDISKQLKELHSELPGNRLHSIEVDLYDVENIKNIIPEGMEKLGGRVDVLINCAGVMNRGSAFDTSFAQFDKVMVINVAAAFELSKLIAKSMKEYGKGKIINMGSILSVLGGYNASAYSTSKGAILQLTKSLSNEWAQYGIQVNALAPGYMKTDMNADLIGDEMRKPQIDARIPAKRWGTPEDLTGPVIFLSTSASDYVTGTIIPVDGGVLAR